MQDQPRFDPKAPSAEDSLRPDREREDRLARDLAKLAHDFPVRAEDRRTLRVPPLDEYWRVAPGYDEPPSRGHARMTQQVQLFSQVLRRGLESADVLDTWVAHQALLALCLYLDDDADGPAMNWGIA